MEIEVRNGGFGDDEARGDNLAHGAELDELVTGFNKGRNGLGRGHGRWCGFRRG